MKVILVNGSPHEKGCTYVGLTEVEKALNENGIETLKGGNIVFISLKED